MQNFSILLLNPIWAVCWGAPEKFLSPLSLGTSSWEFCPALCSCSVKNRINSFFSPSQTSNAEGKAEDVCAGFLQKFPPDAASGIQAPGKCPFPWSTSEPGTRSCCIDIFASSSSSPVTRLDLHSPAPIDLFFLIISGRVQHTEDFGWGIAVPGRISDAVVYVLCCVSVKKPKQKLVWKPFYFHPGAKLNLFMQLAVVLETELELYLHINILLAGRILGLKKNSESWQRACAE